VHPPGKAELVHKFCDPGLAPGRWLVIFLCLLMVRLGCEPWLKNMSDPSLQSIRDKFDTDNAEHLVLIGYPHNAGFLQELIFWSCFPNDPVCWITYPYVSVLRDDILLPELVAFVQFNIEKQQADLADTALAMFADERGQPFRQQLLQALPQTIRQALSDNGE